MSVAAPSVNQPRKRWTRFILPAYVTAVIVFTLVPIVVMIVYGFNKAPSGRLTFAWNGFSLDGYTHLFQISDLTSALYTSLEVATLSTLIATAIGVPAALAMTRYRYRGRGTSDAVILADVAAPSVVVGASLLGFYVSFNVPRGFLTILIAHVAFNVAFVVIVLRARLRDFDRALEEAARDLGADPWTTFWKITFPLIFPGILAAALLAFALSIDDYIITSFVAGQTLTFPLWVYGAVKVGIPPQVFVMGTLIFVAGVILALANVGLQRRAARHEAMEPHPAR